MADSLLNTNNVIFHEMMSHPGIFTHPHPNVVTLLGDEEGSILSEVVKHPNLTEIHYAGVSPLSSIDPRIITYPAFPDIRPQSLDVLITLKEPAPHLLQQYFDWLDKEGILIQAAASPFDALPLKSLVTHIKTVGFEDLHILHFPQPHYPSGWRTAIVALKQGIFKRLREKVIYNKPFKTHYYNFDIHCASRVLPEFMRETVLSPPA